MLCLSFTLQAREFMLFGDEIGSGEDNLKPGRIFLKQATVEIQNKIQHTDFPYFLEFPDAKNILQQVLVYDHIKQLPSEERRREEMQLSLDYSLNPAQIITLKGFYQTCQGDEYDMKNFKYRLYWVKRKLLKEASHIWGLNDEQGEAFGKSFLEFEQEERSEHIRHTPSLSNLCVCENKEALSGPQCGDFCSSVPEQTTPMLYATGIVSVEDRQNGLSNIKNWCDQPVDDGNANPACKLNIRGSGEFDEIMSLDIHFNHSGTKFFAPVTMLEWKKNYLVKLEEQSSGVSSNGVNIRLEMPRRNITPLFETSVSSYHCFLRILKEHSEHKMNYLNAFPGNFFFTESPEPIPYQRGEVFCHDIFKFGVYDSYDRPRLGYNAKNFYLFDPSDERFYDFNGNGKLDINDEIEDEIRERHGVVVNAQLIKVLGALDNPFGRQSKKLGGIIQSFKKNRQSFCPTQKDYHSDNPIFNVLGDFLQTDTEALYFAKRENIRNEYGTAPEDHLFIREGLLKRIWFQMTPDGEIVEPNVETLGRLPLLFYWPSDLKSPYLKHPHQYLYVVKTPEEEKLNILTEKTNSSDKRIGCVPKLYEYTTTQLLEVGKTCQSDLQCQSSCCGTAGKCRRHEKEFQCNKPAGASCISKAFCSRSMHDECRVYRVGVDGSGNNTCALVCIPKEIQGDCLNNVCQPTLSPTPEPFDPNDQVSCDQAPEYPGKYKDFAQK